MLKKLFSKSQRFAKKLQRSGCYTKATVKETTPQQRKEKAVEITTSLSLLVMTNDNRKEKTLWELIYVIFLKTRIVIH